MNNQVASIPSFEQMRNQRAKEKKIYFNPLRRIRTNIDKLNADSFIEIAHRRDQDVDPASYIDCNAITVVNQHHNTNEFFDQQQV